MLTTEQLQACEGQTVMGADGGKIGEVQAIVQQDQPWLSIKTGLFGRKTTFVPAAGAEERDGDLWLVWNKDMVKDAPDAEDDTRLTDDEAQRLAAYFDADLAAKDGGTPAQEPSAGAQDDDEESERDARRRGAGMPAEIGHQEAPAPEQPDDVPVTHDEDSDLRDPDSGDRRDAGEMVRPEVVSGVRPKDSDEIDSSKEKLDENI